MKKTIEYIDLETGEIQTFETLLPNALPARLTNRCEAMYKATVKQNKDAEMNDPFQAIADIKEEVMDYLLDNWIKKDIDLDQIRGKSMNEIVAEYQEDLYGVSAKKKDSSQKGQKDTSDNGTKEDK